MDNRPIGMFDSGIGGINVYHEIKKVLPREPIIYLGDTKRFPYGNKTEEEMIQITKENIEFLITKNVKCIVIACGTATSYALDKVKKQYDIPIIGIISPTIAYIKRKKKNAHIIGVIATQGSIKSKKWENSLKQELENCQVICKATPLLANIAEEGLVDKKESKKIIKEYMKDFKTVDELILGCTHYPLFRKLIEEQLDPHAGIIDIGVAMAEFLKEELTNHQMENRENVAGDLVYLTSIEENIEQYGKMLSRSNNIKNEFQEELYQNQIIYRWQLENKAKEN